MLPTADFLYACDGKWWDHWYPLVKAEGFRGICWTQDKKAADEYNLNWIESRAEPGLSKDTSYICQGKNSGYQAINLAKNFGADRIVLLGFDQQATNGKSHWFGNHPEKLHDNWHFDRFIACFRTIKTDIEIINCSRETALDCFPRARLSDVL